MMSIQPRITVLLSQQEQIAVDRAQPQARHRCEVQQNLSASFSSSGRACVLNARQTSERSVDCVSDNSASNRAR